MSSASFFVNIWLKFFFLFTPFFALSMFLTLTKAYSEAQRRKLSLQVTVAVGLACFFIFFFGNFVFAVFGITVDAFRVGAGALLFISAVGLVQAKLGQLESKSEEDISVVPLAMPVIVGPATIGTLLVFGADLNNTVEAVLGAIALITAVASVGVLLFLATYIERLLGKRGLNILSKMTGLILAALAAQMVITGVQNVLKAG